MEAVIQKFISIEDHSEGQFLEEYELLIEHEPAKSPTEKSKPETPPLSPQRRFVVLTSPSKKENDPPLSHPRSPESPRRRTLIAASPVQSNKLNSNKKPKPLVKEDAFVGLRQPVTSKSAPSTSCFPSTQSKTLATAAHLKKRASPPTDALEKKTPKQHRSSISNPPDVTYPPLNAVDDFHLPPWREMVYFNTPVPPISSAPVFMSPQVFPHIPQKAMFYEPPVMLMASEMYPWHPNPMGISPPFPVQSEPPTMTSFPPTKEPSLKDWFRPGDSSTLIKVQRRPERKKPRLSMNNLRRCYRRSETSERDTSSSSYDRVLEWVQEQQISQ